MIAFTVFYAFVSRRGGNFEPTAAVPVKPRAPVKPRQEFTAGAVGLALVLCFAVVAVAAPHAYRSVETAEVASPASLVMNRFLLFLPSATLLILLHETVRSGRKLLFSRVCVLLLLFLLVIVTENPYTEKRNALGPMYLALLLVLFQNWFATGTRRLLLLVGSMVLVFPAITIFTHNHKQTLADVSLSQFSDQIADHYFSVNYDSWANIYTAVEIVKVHGMQWGHQLMGSLLFLCRVRFGARNRCNGNISGRLPHHKLQHVVHQSIRAARRRGVPGLRAGGRGSYACILAIFVALLNRLALRRDGWVAFPMAIYASVFLMIVLRGSLMIAMGFASAAFLAFCFAAVLLSMKLGVRHRVAGRMGARPLVS